jgi:hypothetical protein
MTATIHPLRKREPTLAPLLALTAPGLTAVNHVIIDRMQSPVSLIPELAGHLIAGGGKRLRPMLRWAVQRCSNMAGRGITSWRRRWSLFTQRRCCLMMWSMRLG